ncbi:uncharacterized protein MELLADRAFT_67161 [Melampsora larici-populina 98AG31]|uniref:Uncharacterized protein n=1 Tax=Melampsora larici-populina (strain 98AG31 / pathotype 3-4-7) TaxID=747676 RepID=F4S208_MELLP|nr:uncharacterized protein MELLADRAFT_67161 [Melampsora larici-populina 98AG31]EGG01345.1 hypothetical protein MELLADRAFT_67161 [Melampsora larici-populina 98AG31]
MNEIENHKNLPNHKSLVAARESIDHENEEHLASFLQNDTPDIFETDDVPEAGLKDERIESETTSPQAHGYTEALMQLLTGNYSDSESECSDRSERVQHTELADVDWDAILLNKLKEDVDHSSSNSDSGQSSGSDIDNHEIEDDITKITSN